MNSNLRSSLDEVSQLARGYYSQGWMFATGGNLSIREGEGLDSFWVTSSGLEKDKLNPDLFLPVSVSTGEAIPQPVALRPSAETSIHTAVYRSFSHVGAVLHIHPPETAVFSYGTTKQNPVAWIPLPPLEMVKGLGIWDENPTDRFLVIYNFAQVSQIAETLESVLRENPQYRVPFFLVETHGPTVWGKDLKEANRNLEALVYLFRVMVARGSAITNK